MALRTRQFDESWGFLASLFDTSGEVSTGLIIDRTPLAELADWAARRAADAHLIEEWTRFRDLDERIARAGISSLLTEVLDGQLTVDEAADAFQARFFRSWLDEVYARDPALRDFGTETHERLISQFRELDEESIRLGYTRIREKLLGDRVAPEFALGDVPGSSELGVLMKEVQKKKRHLPLRKLFARIPGQLLRLKPCLMMSPLAVSTYLDSPELTFDLVVFDEASQVRPHDAICAIYRGRQLVVAGDQKQLPPTDFFTKSVDGDDLTSDDDAEEDGQSLADFESVLDVCCTLGMPRRRLRWHYRSRRESLIAFSNRHLYDNELVTFPSVHDTGDDRAVRLDFVAEGRWRSGSSGGYNVEEARRVAQQVLQHFREHPEQSLGVIAFSQRQQTAILDELERLRRTDPSLEGYFAESAEEPFFVKNLENVQGDERDAILLSVGYGRDESGRLAMRFGPINRLGGERRLNVAITRARMRMTVVSSIRAQDIDTARTSSDGPALLRAYLDYAERGVEALAAATTEDEGRDFDSPFEREVAAALARRGLEVRKQIGCGGYRIDLALVDPEQPGRYVLGVECDGATYHSTATARDRDRLRQQVLESLGWRICRIWSTDWVRNPARQVDRVVQAYEAARRELASPAPAVTGPDRAAMSAEPPAEKVSRPRGPVAGSIQPRYASIDEVPAEVIRDVVTATLRSFGSTGEDEVKKHTTQQLGFLRMGAKIQAKIGGIIEGLLREGMICRTSDGALRLAQPIGLKRG